MPPGRFTACALVAVLAAASAGCGNRDARDDVRSAAAAFYAAVARKDGAAACRRLGDATRSELEQSEGAPCAKAVVQLKLQGGPPARADVFEDSADVQFAGGDRVFLDHESGAWLVSAAGCRPEGPPTQAPLDCEVQD